MCLGKKNLLGDFGWPTLRFDICAHAGCKMIFPRLFSMAKMVPCRYTKSTVSVTSKSYSSKDNFDTIVKNLLAPMASRLALTDKPPTAGTRVGVEGVQAFPDLCPFRDETVWIVCVCVCVCLLVCVCVFCLCVCACISVIFEIDSLVFWRLCHQHQRHQVHHRRHHQPMYLQSVVHLSLPRQTRQGLLA